MPVQIVGNYTYWSEFHDASGDGIAMYSNACTDAEAIASACDAVRDGHAKVHVRRNGEYLAEVRAGYQGAIIVEHHTEGGLVTEYELPCFMRLVSAWLEALDC